MADIKTETEMLRFYFQERHISPKDGIIMMGTLIADHCADLETLENVCASMRKHFLKKHPKLQ